MKTTINLQKSNINVINQLLSLEGETNANQVRYKKTAIDFKKRHGIDLEKAPIVFVKHDHIWKLSHYTYQSTGRTFETAEYLPIVKCGSKFQRLEKDIKTEWD